MEKHDFNMMLKKYEILVYYGDAFYVDEEFKRAEVLKMLYCVFLSRLTQMYHLFLRIY